MDFKSRIYAKYLKCLIYRPKYSFKETGGCQINIIWYLFTLGPGEILG